MTIQGVSISWPALLPIIILAAGGLLVMLVDLVSRAAPRALLYGIGIVASLAALASMLPLYGRAIVTLNGAFAADRFSWTVDALLLITLAITFLLSSLRRADDGGSPGAYAALLIFCTIGGMVMAGANNLIIIFLGIEQLSLALYVLAGCGYPRPASQEASLKYVLLGSLASGFLIYGSALLYGSAGSVALAALAKPAAILTPLFVVGFALFIVGIAFKLALSPFHTWTPDVYEGSPLAVTAYMSVAVKLAGFAVLARVLYVVFGHDSVALVPLWLLAIFSMLVGNLGALRQRNLKRLLAFSSIAQAGYIVAALAGVQPGGLGAMLFYLVAYAFTNLGAFAVIALLGDGDEAYADLDAYRGLFFRRPWPAAALALFVFSLAGIPATAGFYGKILLLQQSLQAGPWGLALAVALVLGTLLSFYAYGKIVWMMYAYVEGEAPQAPGNSLASWVAIAAGAVGTLLLGILPQVFYATQPFLSAALK